MTVVIVFAIVGIALFFAAFVAKRRFGLLGFALAAGSILSTLWSYDAGLVVSTIGVFPAGVVTSAITTSLIVVLPALLLLFHGHAHKHIVGRVLGAAMFAILALALLVEPLGRAFVLEGVGVGVYGWLVTNKDLIISVSLVLAVVDLFFTKPVSKPDKHSRH